jgi:hypothetical protein
MRMRKSSEMVPMDWKYSRARLALATLAAAGEVVERSVEIGAGEIQIGPGGEDEFPGFLYLVGAFDGHPE